MSASVTAIGEQMDPEQRLRLDWSESLQEHMEAHDVSVKQLRHRLSELGVEITRQGIESWLKGATSPRPLHQAALGTVFNVPARRLFPIENLPKAG